MKSKTDPAKPSSDFPEPLGTIARYLFVSGQFKLFKFYGLSLLSFFNDLYKLKSCNINAPISVMPEGGGARDRVGTLIRKGNFESKFITLGLRFEFKVPHLGKYAEVNGNHYESPPPFCSVQTPQRPVVETKQI